ncbi:hypothetical protein [Anaerococcus tetradius]|uniref:Uncharacterized protein n=1 Tax=Anaerococcus tetradius TaxID=33036 RepID=A0A133KDE0_9FIRM|nr:hypothetical protein [Anaerococcus tetradius]KWZ77576.1 hypothetical protein HMPREF3200_01397 [Anaerococcus tetradius]
MSKVNFKLNRKGVSELLKGEKMQEVLKDEAKKVLNRAGGGFTMDVMVGKTRANAMVKADTPKAYYKNLRNNTLVKSL